MSSAPKPTAEQEKLAETFWSVLNVEYTRSGVYALAKLIAAEYQRGREAGIRAVVQIVADEPDIHISDVARVRAKAEAMLATNPRGESECP